MLLFVLLCAVPLAIRYWALKRPLRLRWAALVSLGWMLGLVALGLNQTVIGSSTAATLFILIAKRRLKRGEAGVSTTDSNYVICGSCKFEQWSGYPNCQRCGSGLAKQS
jgi:hypothetical protein